MHVRSLQNRILVQRLEECEQQVGAITMPDSAREKPQRGTVIAAGNGKPNDDGERVLLNVRAGDTILFGKCAGQEITRQRASDKRPLRNRSRATCAKVARGAACRSRHRHNHHRQPMAAFQTLLGLGTGRALTLYRHIRGARDVATG